ncbi:MAG: hypothetical protein KDB04_13860 [Acidimicrobiales bacterium]|nr:hypothetical protein [Acidimicrobiales bacterium]
MLDGSGGRAGVQRPAHRRRGALALTTFVALGTLAAPVPAAAQGSPAEQLAAIRPAETPGIDPVLDAVAVRTTPTLRRAEDRLASALADQREASLRLIDAQRTRQERALRATEADQRVIGAEQAFQAAQQQLADEEAELDRRVRTERRTRAALTVEQDRLRQMAANLYATAPDDTYAVLGSLSDFTEADRRDAARDRGVEVQSEAVEDARAPWEAARQARTRQERRTDAARSDAAEALASLAEARDDRDHAAERLGEAERAVGVAQASFDEDQQGALDALAGRREARLEADVDAAPLTLVALHAYWRAAQLAPCRVPWWVIAGVGRVETRHGTAFGSRVTPDGDTTVHIIGIPLDGRPGTLAVGDTDGGRLDADPVWDRAVGPMQFLPGTWGRLGRDGNGDGVADPHNLYDAASAAAGLLCLGGGDLLDEGAQRAALLRYNRSVPYGSQVLAEGGRYRDALPELDDLPPIPELDPAGG